MEEEYNEILELKEEQLKVLYEELDLNIKKETYNTNYN